MTELYQHFDGLYIFFPELHDILEKLDRTRNWRLQRVMFYKQTQLITIFSAKNRTCK